MLYDNKILIGMTENDEIFIYPEMANRHGLISGATGTGKTVTLRVMAESFSELGVPVFLADAKGDLGAMKYPGGDSDSVKSRVENFSLKDMGFEYTGFPVSHWDVFGEGGIPLRTTVSEMGPLLLSRILELNDTQKDILEIIFKIADDEGLLLVDTKDLKAMISYVSEKSKEYSVTYGNMAKQSLSAILRNIVSLEAAGGELFFAEPALDLHDWLATDSEGRGKIQILDCRKLMLNPTMYATFLLWLISELFEMLPEAGDMSKPKMVFFFDEAHMLFTGAPKALLEKITQLVKLIRSKGVGIYFITQNPTDIPDSVLSQLGNKIQHALRAYTPAEQKKMKAAAQSYRANPAFDTYEALSELGTGEALISVLAPDGIPTMVERATILPPESKLGALDDLVRRMDIAHDEYYNKYAEYVDNDSAYEFMQRRQAQIADEAFKAAQQKEEELRREKARKQGEKVISDAGKSVAGTAGREVGNALGNAVGGKFGKRIGGNLGATLGRGLFATLFSKKK